MSDSSNDPLPGAAEAQAERIRELERQLRERDAALDAVLAENQALKNREHAGAPAAETVHRSPWRVRARNRITILGGRLLPRPVKELIKLFWNPWPQSFRIAPRGRLPRGSVPAAASWDIVCFPIIDWNFRWQRPQQLLSQLADAGHRVFVFSTSTFLQPGGRRFEIAKMRENVWEVTIASPVMVDVYGGTIDGQTVEWLQEMLDEMRCDLDIACAVSIVHVATWEKVALEARRRFGWKVVYDCMDEWASFPGMKAPLPEAEARLVEAADLVTVSAQALLDKWKGRNGRVVLVRNGADFDRFASAPAAHYLGNLSRPVIGYFGAVAPWFDAGLLAAVAQARPQYSFVVIGGVFDVDVRALEELSNVRLLGQQPYERMPAYLHDFDVCIIPFVVDEITAATDPVKFYEYLSAGKPVVSTPLPEIDSFGDLFYSAGGAGGFLEQLDRAVAEDDAPLRARRVEVARANTWSARAELLSGAIVDAHPRVTIAVVSYGNVDLTRDCLESVLRRTMYPNFEVIVVDNASSDGTVEMLEGIRDPRLRVILNARNAGFAAANNQALDVATGEHFILLNNDTVVPRGWLSRMVRHLENPEIGLAVAATNFSGNESRVEVSYTTLDGMEEFATAYMREHDGQTFDIAVAAMYCVGLRRDVWERVGPLDEGFEIGMFEDDDYSHRARLAGYRVICAEDVFVHHVGQGSFSKLPSATYEAIWKRNQALFEKKWGVRWTPHRQRENRAGATS